MAPVNSYDPYHDFIIRTPVFPLDYINLVPSKQPELSQFIIEMWAKPIVRDAIMLSSPSYFNRLEKAVRDGFIPERLTCSFIRYFLRMCYRSTPFGLFAGLGAGVISDETKINPLGYEENHMKCRLDMEYLGALVMSWTRDSNIRKELAFSTNTTLYKLGSKWRYIEVYFGNDEKKKYRIIAAESNPVLDEIVRDSASCRPWFDYVKQLTDIGYTQDEGSAFINELVDAQILIPDIYPNLTGEEFSGRLAKRLEMFSAIHPGPQQFLKLSEMVSTLKEPGCFHVSFPGINQLAGELNPVLNPSHLIQADLKTGFKESAISKELSNNILLGLRILRSLSGKGQNNYLGDFKKHFKERFGTREIPLPLAMDLEYGTGLSGPPGQQMADPCPLLDGLDFPVRKNPDIATPPHPLLLKKLSSFCKTGDLYIQLDREDVRGLDLRSGTWPNQLFALCRLAGSPDKPQIYFDSASSGNPSRLIARFGFLETDGVLLRHMRELVRDDIEAHPDDILAEIVHLPEDRTGNILQRPSLYDREILYMASAGGQAQVILPEEILVKLDNDVVVLTDRKSGKQILPRLTNAHNYRRNQLPLYQFLAECSNQFKKAGFSPSWGWLSHMNEFLPGIKFGDLILSRPRWRLKVDKRLTGKGVIKRDSYEKILSWAKEHNLPEKFVWTEGDQEMIIDLSNFNIVMSAWERIGQRTMAEFKDYIFSEGSPVISDKGTFANELIITFKKSK